MKLPVSATLPSFWVDGVVAGDDVGPAGAGVLELLDHLDLQEALAAHVRGFGFPPTRSMTPSLAAGVPDGVAVGGVAAVAAVVAS